jgi:N-methylhydantoinase B
MRRFALEVDSCGAGEFRGGLGYTREFVVTEPGVLLTTYSDHFDLPPKGLAGGGDGGLARFTITRGNAVLPQPAATIMELQTGDVVSFTVGGGAGWGDPRRRDPARIAADLADGIITPDYAKQRHGWAESLQPGALQPAPE